MSGRPDALALQTLVNRDLVDLPLPEPRPTPRTAQVDELTKEFLSDCWKKETKTYTHHTKGRVR